MNARTGKALAAAFEAYEAAEDEALEIEGALDEEGIARRVITEALDESVMVAVMRWQHFMGQEAEVNEHDDERMMQLARWTVVSWRLAALAFLRDGLNGVKPTTTEDAEDTLVAWSREASA
jgi:hypothetical protein